MIDKKITVLLGSILLVAASMPLTTAHLTNPNGSTISGLWTGDEWRGNGVGGSTMGVSGNYFNDPGIYISSSLFPLTIPDQTGGITGDVTLFPSGFFSSVVSFCDLEVLGDGTSPDPMDESIVDAGPYMGGTIEDGTWDDGGEAGACHTEDQYGITSYNTPGCGGTAFANDQASGGYVWIGSACDETTSSGSSFSLTGCFVNELISGANPAVLIDCIETFINGDVIAPLVVCGSDGMTDSINYGAGGAGVPFPTSGCGGGSAVVYTFVYMNDTVVIPATVGWINT